MSKKKLSKIALGFLLSALFCANINVAGAAAAGSVVINEVAWAGSRDSANDEWIELYNTSGQPADLAGWTIVDDQGASVYALSGQMAAHGYYLIEDSENAVKPNIANAIINLSLANSGDSLVLYDNAGQLIDAVNSTGGMWFAGNASLYASMERVDVLASGDNPANWVSSDGTGSTATGSAGSLIMGTPGLLNSTSVAPVTQAQVGLGLSTASPAVGDMLDFTVHADGVDGLFAYGLEMDYDPAVLHFISAAHGSFLGQNGSVGTSFQSGLENGLEGRLLLAEARTQTVKTGVSGSGDLATIRFSVTGGAGAVSGINFGGASFLSNPENDIGALFGGAQFIPETVQADPVNNIRAAEDIQRYAIKLQWDAPAGGADGYRVYRKNAHGSWVEIGRPVQTEFIDADGVTGGGMIIPSSSYSYRVAAVRNSLESAPAEVTGSDMRGLKGDNTRSDRVDGRDLENLARHFAQTDADSGFAALTDTTYDGQTDGSDLIDLGVNFAKVYLP